MQQRATVSVIISGVILVIVILHFVGALNPIERALRWVLLPPARAVSAIGSGIGSALQRDPDANRLRDQVRELQARLDTMSVDYVRLKALEEENRSLKAIAQFVTGSGYDYVPARIIARSPDPRSAVVTIDRGTIDGVQLGMAVVVGDGIFAGKITSVSDRIAIVTLVSDERSRVAAAAASSSRLFGIVEGRGNNAAQLTLVPQHDALAVNDVIMTAGTEEKIPANLTIGLVNSVDQKDTDPFKEAAIEPLAKTDTLDLVLVVLPTVLRP